MATLKCIQCECAWEYHYTSAGVWYCSSCGIHGCSYKKIEDSTCFCCQAVQANVMEADCDECSDITNAAVDAISVARQDGPTSWRDISIKEHLNHAIEHANAAFFGEEGGEDHLSHAICRLAMAKALR